ncbi:DUF922 domain-containing protein [Motilimonas pumila]|uniref:DUF922 domain-containing protein n=1 Tax=Motilimonas pumila TaxID=2303987 RepID=A0A418YKK7_9GAMM|nr:DUF922 domain-containing protein [Motilimonas pumila]RJG51486.1 DUF922 domain-containing protein [Motilimonas pumila]
MHRLRVCAALLLLLPWASWAEPQLTIRYRHFGFYGLNIEAIRDQLGKQNPEFAIDNIFHTDVDWEPSWSLVYHNDDAGCKIERIHTKLKMEYPLPRWLNEFDAEEELRSRWQDFYQALLEHLDGHKLIAIDALNEVERQVLTLPRYENCETADIEAEEVAQAVIDEYQQKHQEYDQTTRLGFTQGVHF